MPAKYLKIKKKNTSVDQFFKNIRVLCVAWNADHFTDKYKCKCEKDIGNVEGLLILSLGICCLSW